MNIEQLKINAARGILTYEEQSALIAIAQAAAEMMDAHADDNRCHAAQISSLRALRAALALLETP